MIFKESTGDAMETVKNGLAIRLIPWLVGTATFLLVASTASHYGLGWDEPNYLHASDLEIQWIAELAQNVIRGEAAKSLDDDRIKAMWHWDPYHVPHPPFSRILSGLTKMAFSSFMDKFNAYRLAPALFFTLLVTVMYLWMAALFDRATGLFSSLALIVIPNLFGFAHFAVTDIPLAAMWFLTVYCFWRGLNDWRWSVLLGIVWGLALSTKFPALLIPIPLLLWAHLYHRREYANNVFVMCFISPLIMVLSQPYLWHQTFLRILEFLYEGISRAYREDANYPILFFGQPHFTSDLPWYYPFFITAVTTPETILLLSLVGAIALARSKAQREIAVLFSFNVGALLVMGLLPGAVLHDGMRQLLAILPFLAGLAGAGFFVIVRYVTERSKMILALRRVTHLQPKLIGILYLLLLFPPALDLLVYHPYELSYYNRLVGGIQGAYRRGLEVTYFLEVFTPAFLKSLNNDLPPNATVNALFGNFMLTYYQTENRLRPDIRVTDGEDFDYYILVFRRGLFREQEEAFLASRPRLYRAWRLDGAPLILMFNKEGLARGSLPSRSPPTEERKQD
jgi:hypothetical protein